MDQSFAGDEDDFLGIITKVEERWSLLVLEPDPTVASPQVSTQMARNTTTSRHCNFHINASDIPQYEPGGMQLQTWRYNTNTSVATSTNRTIMGTPNELVTWTQRLYKGPTTGKLRFGISEAASTTWGDFSGVEVEIPSGSTNLDDYTVEYSQNNSGVTFGANRVTTLILVSYKKYDVSGLTYEDLTPRVVFSKVTDPQLSNP
jgi:hypothetical protein